MATEHITVNERAARAPLAADLVLAGGWGFASGLLPIDLNDDRVALPEMIEDQLKKAFANLEAILGARGLTKEHVVSVRIHVVDLKRFHERVDAAYAGLFEQGRLPARSVVGVSALPRGALVSMDVIVRSQ
jgi:2-iminobutanoate/2-iminopropanoate deaminase